MNTIEVAQAVLKDGIQLIRPKKDAPGYDIKPAFTGNKKGWIMVDAFSAGALVAVYNVLKTEEQKTKFANAPIQIALNFAWKVVK